MPPTSLLVLALVALTLTMPALAAAEPAELMVRAPQVAVSTRACVGVLDVPLPLLGDVLCFT